jgi:hypothetical protein
LLGLFFNPADGGNMFLRNVGCLSTDYIASYHCCEDHKSYIFYGYEELLFYLILESIHALRQHMTEEWKDAPVIK